MIHANEFLGLLALVGAGYCANLARIAWREDYPEGTGVFGLFAVLLFIGGSYGVGLYR